MPIRAILFDLDNTLTDRTLSLSVFARQFAAYFATLLAESQAFTEIEAVIQAGDGGGYIPKERMFTEIQSLLRWRDEPPSIATIHDYWYRVSPQCMQLRPGVIDTLAALRAMHLKTGIITNGKTTVQNDTIDAVGIRPSMDTIVVSESAGVRKPDAQIFRLALEALDVRANETWFVGDHPAADVAGAQNAGLTPVWFEGGHTLPENMPLPVLRITSIPEVANLVREDGNA